MSTTTKVANQPESANALSAPPIAQRKVQLLKPVLPEACVEEVAEVLRSGWIGLGPRTAKFERQFAEYIGVPHAVGLNNCTAALDLAMRLLDVRHGDEVLVPTLTFVSTAHAVAYNLATPIFVDCQKDSLEMDFDDVRAKITRRTKAVAVVHLSGRPVNMGRLRETVGKLPIIEDCAHACGATLDGRRCGSLGDVGCFSFHAVKNLPMGDGGALTLHDGEFAERARRLRWLGIDRSTWDRSSLEKTYWWQYSVDEVGLKCHMNDIQAALGLVQLPMLDQFNQRRREIAKIYRQRMRELDQIQLPPDDDARSVSSWHLFIVRCLQRDDLSTWLRDRNVEVGVHYKPIHLYRCYGNTPRLPNAERMFGEIMSLPMHLGLSDDDVHYVCDHIAEFYSR